MDDFWNKYLKLTNERIESYFAGAADPLVEAMAYSLNAGGKRLRPILAAASAFALGGDPLSVLDFGLAIECIHTYSLIHDDLPAMDSADLRRGKLSSHRKFGEGVAVLAGDSLLTEAFYILSGLKFPHLRVLEVSRMVAFEAGFRGMCGGQMLDLEKAGSNPDIKTLENISVMKTAALIRASVLGPAILFGEGAGAVEFLSGYSTNIGIAFQMVDDILDVSGDSELTGKPIGLDSREGKETLPLIMGVEETRKRVSSHFEIAIEAIRSFGQRGQYLRGIAERIQRRDR